MTANRASSEISKETGRGYNEIRIAINRLVHLGMTRFNAEQVVRSVAATDDFETGMDDIVERWTSDEAV